MPHVRAANAMQNAEDMMAAYSPAGVKIHLDASIPLQPFVRISSENNLESCPKTESTRLFVTVPESCESLSEAVRGLVLSVKAYERAAIEPALTGCGLAARKAILLYPATGESEPSKELLEQLVVHC